MKRFPVLFIAAVLFSLMAITGFNGTPTANAEMATAEQSMTFAVDKMTCAACPITVRKAMEGVKGVTSVTVDLDAKTATAVFDPSVATSEQIAAASTNAGYPATPAS